MSIFKSKNEQESEDVVGEDTSDTDDISKSIEDVRIFIEKLESEMLSVSSEIRALATIMLRFAPGDKDIKDELKRISSININVRPWGVK